MNVSFEHLLPWFMRECISIFWLECVSLGDTNMPVFLVLKGNSSEDAWKQRQCTEWCKHSNHQCASMWKIVLTTRLFHWHTMASVAQFYNIFRNWFLTMNHHILFNHLLNLAFVFQVWMKTIPKSKFGFRVSPTLSSGFLQLCPQTLGYPPSGAERIWVFSSFWQETQESIVVKLEIAQSSFFFFFFLRFLLFYRLPKRLPQHVPRAWFFHGCLALFKLTILIMFFYKQHMVALSIFMQQKYLFKSFGFRVELRV